MKVLNHPRHHLIHAATPGPSPRRHRRPMFPGRRANSAPMYMLIYLRKKYVHERLLLLCRSVLLFRLYLYAFIFIKSFSLEDYSYVLKASIQE